MWRSKEYFSLLFLFLFSCTSPEASERRREVGIKPVDLKCEYLVNPLGIDVTLPRLSWILKAAGRCRKQTAYQVLAAGTREALASNRGDLWDSGKVVSDQSVQVVYRGKKLQSRQRCFWKVRVWDEKGNPGEFSKPAFWEMGLLAPGDWSASWISGPKPPKDSKQVAPSPFFRKSFKITKPVERARVYVSGLGYYELYLNGGKVGDHVLDPAFTRYDRRRLYVSYDITELLDRGPNVVGVILGNGWYNMHTRAVWNFDKAPWRNRPVVICQVELQFEDGSRTTIGTDSTWKISTGPILFESIRSGETYDARRELTGWSRSKYDAAAGSAAWNSALVVPGSKKILSAQMLPPIKVVKTMVPVKITEPKPGHFIFDMGQNMAGWAQLRVKGPAGTRVVMRYGERLNSDGTMDRKEISKFVKKGAFQTDTYILKGGGEEIWEPRFTYHGFQYVEVTGFPGKPGLGNIRGRVVHTSFDKAGSFESSKELFNRIQSATEWSYVSNFFGYPTDCPQREKNGWTGDAQLAAGQGLLNYDSASAYTKWMNDLKDEQRKTGELPGIVPTGGWGYAWGNGPAWDSAYVLIPWYLYKYCGDTRILKEHYSHLKRYVDYLTSKSSDHIVSIGLNDWAPAKTTTPADITSTGYYYCDTVIVSKIAKLMGHDKEAADYSALAQKIKDAFNRHFYDSEKAIYRNGSQTALSCALYHGLVDPAYCKRVLKNLVDNIERHDGHLDAGILGTKYLLNVLPDYGMPDVAYQIASQTTFPSWGYWIRQGATTLWEQWNGGGSHNHIMFGDISAFFYKQLAGIRQEPGSTAYKRIVIAPKLLGDLTWVRASHRSMYGLIKSEWRIENGDLVLNVTIPANTMASIFVPVKDTARGPAGIKEGGVRADKSVGVTLLKMVDGAAVFSVGSGTYNFSVKL